MRRTTPAEPSKPVEPALSFANDQGTARPPANPEPLLPIQNAMSNNDHLIFAFHLPRWTCSSHRSNRGTLSQLSFMP